MRILLNLPIKKDMSYMQRDKIPEVLKSKLVLLICFCVSSPQILIHSWAQPKVWKGSCLFIFFSFLHIWS